MKGCHRGEERSPSGTPALGYSKLSAHREINSSSGKGKEDAGVSSLAIMTGD